MKIVGFVVSVEQSGNIYGPFKAAGDAVKWAIKAIGSPGWCVKPIYEVTK